MPTLRRIHVPLHSHSPTFKSQFADEEHPFAFDVFCAGITFLRLCWPMLKTDAQLAAFRAEMQERRNRAFGQALSFQTAFLPLPSSAFHLAA
eukprot:6184721-Pleurochrysis_carterae.AAC.2